MPPHASQQQDSTLVFDDHNTGLNAMNNPDNSDPFVDVPLGSSKYNINTNGDDAASATPSTTNSAESSSAEGGADESLEAEEQEGNTNSVLERLLDFNPCSGMASMTTTSFSLLPNPSSAVFKFRPCSECGRKCTKMQGYTKEIVETKTNTVFDEETSTGEEEPLVETKIYFHKWCSQIKEYRQDHKEQFQPVMRNLLDHFRALELEAQMKREGEIRKARRKEESLKKKARAEAAKAEFAANNNKARDAPLEVNLVEKKPSLMKRVKKSFSMKGCKGNKAATNAVDESAFHQQS